MTEAGRKKQPGEGIFECDHTGLIVERFPDGSVSYDLFDAMTWPGGGQEGFAYARILIDALGGTYYEK